MRVQFPTLTGHLQPQYRGALLSSAPVHGPNLGSPREAAMLCGVTCKAGGPEGELWWVKASFQLGPAHVACLGGEKGKELSPLIHSRALSTLMGGSADMLLLLVCYSGHGRSGSLSSSSLLFQVALRHLS